MKPARPFPAAVWAAGRTLTNPRFCTTRTGSTPVAFITTNGERAEIALIRLGEEGERWLPCDPPVRRSSASMDWLPDGTGLVYLGIDGCLHRISLETLRCDRITSDVATIANVAVSPDGTRVAYVDDTRHVMVVPVEGESSEPLRLSSGADFVFDPSWSPDGRFVAWHEWDVPDMPWDGGRIAVRESDAGGPVRTVAGGAGIAVQQPRFSPDGKHLAFLSDEQGWLNLWVLDFPEFDSARPLIQEQFEHGEPAWGPGQRSYAWAAGGDEIVFVRNDKGVGRLMWHSLRNGRTEEISQGTFTGLQAAGRAVVGTVTDSRRGTELQLINGEWQPVLARGPLVGIEAAGVTPEHVEWQSFDGTLVPGRLYRSDQRRDGGPGPLLVWVHGGPHGQSPATLYARWSYFLQRGWSVLVPDYRGSSGWGRAHLQALRRNYGVVDVEDVASGILAAGERGWGAPDSIVPFGGSSAGLTIAWVLIRHPELSAAAVIEYPLVDLRSFHEETWRFEAHYLDSLIGPLPAAGRVYADRSPLLEASKIVAPVLVLHGDADNVVPLEQSRAFVEEIRKSGGVAGFHVYEGEGHGWRKPATQVDELERVQAFLEQYVLQVPATEET